ncbi:hypothetical protein OAN38_00310 [Candidatus Marinimicrobia bacterium]|nr:hypothetical protein [Candidatus Neomarinimicrobiota bacterium]
MGRGINTAFSILESATRPSCNYCSNNCKNRWVNDDYPSKVFCKKSCANKFEKAQEQMKDEGCSLCGKKNPSLRYYEHGLKKYCKKKHYEIGISDAIVLKINYS